MGEGERGGRYGADERESDEKRDGASGGRRESVAMQIKRCEGETERETHGRDINMYKEQLQ